MEHHLFICRHAEAELPDFKQADIDRALTRNGIKEAEQAGNWILNCSMQPIIIISSSAKRTLQTSRLIASLLKYDLNKIYNYPELYNAPATKILDVLSIQSSTIKNILVVGHNPGITDLVSILTGAYHVNVPTGSVHHLWFDINDWSELNFTTSKGYLTNTPD